MRRLVKALWADECGFVLSSELVLVSTTLVLGLTVALVAVREAISGEFNDLATAFRGLDQSYYKAGMRGCRKPDGSYTSWTAGSGFLDPTLRTSGPQQEVFPDDIDVGGYSLNGKPCAIPAAPCLDCVPPSPIQEAAPCLTCPPLTVPESAPMLPTLPIPSLPEDPAAAPVTSTYVPCLSCPPGANGHFSPMPISAPPTCSSPVNLSGAPTQFAPIYGPYAQPALGPLQVW